MTSKTFVPVGHQHHRAIDALDKIMVLEEDEKGFSFRTLKCITGKVWGI